MDWVMKLLHDSCEKLNIRYCSDGLGIQIGSSKIKITDDEPGYTIQIIDFEALIEPKHIKINYWDQLQTSIEETIQIIKPR